METTNTAQAKGKANLEGVFFWAWRDSDGGRGRRDWDSGSCSAARGKRWADETEDQTTESGKKQISLSSHSE